MLFRSHLLKHVLSGMNKKQQRASKFAGLMWNHHGLPQHVKKAWDERAKLVSEWHREKYPAYKFCPRKPVPKAGKNDDESDTDEQLQKYMNTHFSTSSPLPRSPRKHKQPRSVRGVARDSDYDDDDDDEYVPRSRTSRRPATRLPTPSSSDRSPSGPSASPYGATSPLYPTPPTTPQEQSARIAKLEEAHRILTSQFAAVQAAAAASGAPTPDLSHPLPQLSYPFAPPFMSMPDFCALPSLGLSSTIVRPPAAPSPIPPLTQNTQPYAPTPQYPLPAFDPFQGNTLGLDSLEDVFGPVAAPNAPGLGLSPLIQPSDVRDPASLDFKTLASDSPAPPAAAAPEDFMGRFFDFGKFQSA